MAFLWDRWHVTQARFTLPDLKYISMLCIVLLKLFHDSASDSFDRVYRPNRLASVQMIGEPSVLRSFANHPPVLSFVAHLVLVSSWYGEENGYPDVNESPDTNHRHMHISSIDSRRDCKWNNQREHKQRRRWWRLLQRRQQQHVALIGFLVYF